MTAPDYLNGCPAESQARGLAWADDPQSNAWNVNLNNGNANNWNQNNQGLALPVRGPVPLPGEYRGANLFRALWQAWIEARRQKSSPGQLRFEAQLLDRLFELERQLLAGTWSPSPAACFIAQRPKAREIHAPAFGDRVVHHWLVPQLERIYEPTFIHDSYSNRRGKGTHAAVARLQTFMRQVHSGQGGGWFLQLDIRNCFNSIHRPTLSAELERRMTRHRLPQYVQVATLALLRQPISAQGVHYFASVKERMRVPPHKRLENASPDCGLPIGNLSSQFFANVYLDRLDQFIKHQLKAKRYVRYVDDFVLVHRDREQLLEWLPAIQHFLREFLQLELKPEMRLKPIEARCDFLGYPVHPTHLLTRPRVLQHAREALQAWEHAHVRGKRCRGFPDDFRRAEAVWESYQGHLRHARSHTAQQRLLERFPWLRAATAKRRFHHRMEGRRVCVPILEAP